MVPLILIPAAGAGLLLLAYYGRAVGWRIMRINKNTRLFEGLARKHNNELRFVEESSAFGLNTPYLKGELSGLTVHVYTQAVSASAIWSFSTNIYYDTIIRVESGIESKVRYTVKRATTVRNLLAAVSDKDITTGHPQFDSLFVLNCNDEEFALKLFDQFVCEDFSVNADTFEFTSLTFKDGYLEFRERQLVRSNARMARIDEIMQFMVYLVERGNTYL